MENKKQIEVELRGPLTDRKLKTLSAQLKREDKFLGRKKQTVIFFQKNKLLNLPKDYLRLQIDENGEKVCLKIKSQIGANQEVEFFLKIGQYKKAIMFFKSVGFTNYSVSPAQREDFLYHGAMISLKWRCVIGPHFEIEKIVSQKNNIKKARESLLLLIRKLGLKVWTDKAYSKYKSYCWDKYRLTGRLK